MKVFVTGASGFIGSAVVQELLKAGHEVTGLARSEAAAAKISAAGATPLQGDLENVASLQAGAKTADAVLHLGFIHDFSQYAQSAETDRKAILAMGEVLTGTSKLLVVTAGSLGLPMIDGFVTEASTNQNGIRGSEAAAMQLAEGGVYASVIRLPPSVHDKGDQGFVPFIIGQALKNGVSAYPNDGNNRWPAVHRSDAAKLFLLAMNKGAKGALYNAIGDEGISIKTIAATIADHYQLPLQSVTGDAITAHFGWMAGFIGFDNPATATETRRQLGWTPTGIGLLEDMKLHYFSAQ